VFFVDELERSAKVNPSRHVIDRDGEVQRRRMRDGSEFRVVKVFYEPAALTARLEGLGWAIQIESTPRLIYGTGRAR
jgi:hypothetical protein